MKKLFQLFAIILFAAGCSGQNDPLPVPQDAKPIVLRVGLEKRVTQDN